MIAEIKLDEISENNKVPKGCNKKKGKELGALRIKEENTDELIEEISRKNQFDEESDINSNEKITYTNEVDETDWIISTLGLTSRLTEFPYSNAK